ncbi:MurR/RpiR family transcriptional regulator [Brachybacterium huguangmaarense]
MTGTAAGSGASSGGTSVLVHLRGVADDLSGALASLARTVLADPGRASTLTIGDLAREADCSEATVVRFTHELGCSGYRDFRLRLAEDTAIERSHHDGEVFAGDIDAEDDLATVVGKIAAADARAARATASSLDLAVLADLAAAIAGARRIAVFGAGASGLAAQDLGAKLGRIGLMCTAHVDAHAALPAAALLGKGDVAIALSHSGRTDDVVAALRVARAAGARTAAITNSPASPLVAQAEHLLTTAATESALRSGATASRIAQLTVVDCVFVAVARLLPDLGRDALRRTREAIADRRSG